MLAALGAELAKNEGRVWALGNVPFLSRKAVGTLLCDTGAGVTCVSRSFLERAGLLGDVRAHEGGRRPLLRLGDGTTVDSVGVVDLGISIQVMLDVSEEGAAAPLYVHWDRRIQLLGVWVMAFTAVAPRDLYISYADWGFGRGGTTGPLGDLAQMVLHGARVAATPRAPREGDDVTYVVRQSGDAIGDVPTLAAVAPADGGVVETHPEEMNDDELRAAIAARIAPARRDSAFARLLVEKLVERRKVFARMDVSETTVVVDMTLVGTPKPVSFRVPIRRGAQSGAAEDGLHKWVASGVAEHVPWDTPAYGFVIVVPKPGGKWRVTVNPSETNRVTERVDIDGGFMPDNMIREAQRAGRGCRFAAALDFAEAFTGLKLGPRARELSVFTTPIGKLRWLQGYFGWHGFPAEFQRAMMERVVLPSLDDVPMATILAWIDDVLLGGDDELVFMEVLLHVIDRALQVGWRLSLSKCKFLYDDYDWCGVEVDVVNGNYRVSRERVKSLMDTPIPDTREALLSVCGVLRYYYWGVADHMAMRERLAKLLELDTPRVVLKDVWTSEHTAAMRAAMQAVVDSDWIMCYDPSRPVYVTCDAAGNLGYGVSVFQIESGSGRLRPIGYYSSGWLVSQRSQLKWPPQVKECYAKRQAVCLIMPRDFPHAYVILLNDNKNLSEDTVSKDPRVVRWRHDIDCSGVREQWWIPGDENSIADYASRSVRPVEAEMNAEDAFEMYLYAMAGGPLEKEEGAGGGAALTGDTRVPGHLVMAPLAAEIATAQAEASLAERETWTGGHYSTAVLGGVTLYLYRDRLIVPRGAVTLKERLMRMVHDGGMHYTGAERTAWALARQARVYWGNIAEDVRHYVSSCFKCAAAKAPHVKANAGELNPTLAPHVHHTWYVDLKGPMPYETGYIMIVVEAISRYVRLRYLPSATAKEVTEELMEVIVSFGTRPVVLRSDGGQPFDSVAYREFCKGEGITPVLGAPHHSQGQGAVETKIREIAAAIIATLGAKAEREWFKGPWLSILEGIINSTVVMHMECSPYGVLHGREPRTRAAALADWSAGTFGVETLGISGATLDDINEIVAQYHAVVRAVQERVILGSSVQQALTKKLWDAGRVTRRYTVGEYVLVHVNPLNRMRSWYTGPFVVTRVTPDGNFVYGAAFVDPDQVETGPYHVTRLRLIDMSRATVAEVAAHQLEAGSAFVVAVLGHRVLDNGAYEFEIEWLGTERASSWVPSTNVRLVTKVMEYCRTHGLKAPGTEYTPNDVNGRGRGGRRGGVGRGRSAVRGGTARGGRYPL
jgi:hypothetical protein